MDWYYHAPGRGRVGPLSADAMREHYRDRRIEPDTLVWHEGLREWQPLERQFEELDLASVKPDTSRPPPLPPGAPPGMALPPVYAAASSAGHGPAMAMRAEPARKGMSGCLIALIVVAVVAVPTIGILAAIAVPAYQDYTTRAKLATAVDARARRIETAIAASAATRGRCPASAEEAGVSDAANVDFGTVGSACAFRITVQGVGRAVDGRSIDFYSTSGRNDAWDCTGGDLPAKYRPPQCRPDPEPVR